MTIVTACVAAQGWINLTDAPASWWAEEMLGKPTLYMGRAPGVIRKTWVTPEGVFAEIALDESVRDEAVERFWAGAIA